MVREVLSKGGWKSQGLPVNRIPDLQQWALSSEWCSQQTGEPAVSSTCDAEWGQSVQKLLSHWLELLCFWKDQFSQLMLRVP